MLHQRRGRTGLAYGFLKKTVFFSGSYYFSNNIENFFAFHICMRQMFSRISLELVKLASSLLRAYIFGTNKLNLFYR